MNANDPILEQIWKDFGKRIRNSYLILGIAAIIGLGPIFYNSHKYDQDIAEANTKKTQVVQQYLYLKDNILPYLRTEFIKQQRQKFDGSLINKDLKVLLDGIDERDEGKNRSLEGALLTAVHDSINLAKTQDVKEYNDKLNMAQDFSNKIFNASLFSLLGLGGLSVYMSFRAVKKKREALKQINKSS